MTRPVRFAAIGIDHRHIFGMAANLISSGAEFAGWWTEGHPNTESGFLSALSRHSARSGRAGHTGRSDCRPDPAFGSSSRPGLLGNPGDGGRQGCDE